MTAKRNATRKQPQEQTPQQPPEQTPEQPQEQPPEQPPAPPAKPSVLDGVVIYRGGVAVAAEDASGPCAVVPRGSDFPGNRWQVLAEIRRINPASEPTFFTIPEKIKRK